MDIREKREARQATGKRRAEREQHAAGPTTTGRSPPSPLRPPLQPSPPPVLWLGLLHEVRHTGLRGAHVGDLAGAALDHHVVALPDLPSFDGDGFGRAGVGTLKVEVLHRGHDDGGRKGETWAGAQEERRESDEGNEQRSHVRRATPAWNAGLGRASASAAAGAGARCHAVKQRRGRRRARRGRGVHGPASRHRWERVFK